MGESELANARNNFERNQTDVFTIAGSDIGKLTEATVRLEIEVLNKVTGAKSRFVYNDWLEKNEKTPTLTVTLPEASSEAAKAARKQAATAARQYSLCRPCIGCNGCKTSEAAEAAREQIAGPNGMLNGAEIYLDNSKNNFEKGRTDVFNLDFPPEKDCGTPVQKIVLEMGSTMTLGADWHLDWIEVTDIDRNHTYKWRCGHWFNSKEGTKKEWSVPAVLQGLPMQLTLVEAPGGADPSLGNEGDPYHIEISTSDKFGAGTDATIRVAFTDIAGATWQPVLGQDNSMFQRKNWVPPDQGADIPAQVLSDMPLEGRPQRIKMQSLRCCHNLPSTTRLWCTRVVGSLGKATHVFDQAGSLFERKAVDEFTVRIPDCGDLMSVRIWHDGRGLFPSWYLGKLSMLAVPYGSRWEAVFNVWIKRGEDNAPSRPFTLVEGVPPSQIPGAHAPIDPRIAQVQAEKAAKAAAPPVLKPGDDGVSEKVLNPVEFKYNPAMQDGNLTHRLSRDPTQKPEPKCDWQRHTQPYAPDPRYNVTYFHNSATGESTYDVPPDFTKWEAEHSDCVVCVGV
eukprot:gene18431-24907_t